MAFSLKMLSRKTLSVEDVSYLSKLLNTNMSVGECFTLLENRANKEIFADIRNKLDQGEMIESVIKDHLPKQLKTYVISLLNTLSLSASLSLALKFDQKAQEGQRELINSLAYPLILLFITMTSLYLFDLYGIDSIFTLISTFDADLKLFDSLRLVFRIVINVFYYLVLILFVLSLFFFKPANVIILYIFVSKYLPNSLLNIHYSQEFMALFLICSKAGYKTRQSLEILKAMTSKPVISFLAFHLDESLMEGESLKEATRKNYYDSSLSRFIKIANYTNEFSEVIGSYVELSRERIRRRIKRYTSALQMMTYIFIGLIIIFIYQILFMPMQAISMY
ncbi:MAG: type II secretion system F family protein [Erysipelotrichaceae bacterium]|nr:type II secretion system F family protein [Erysipelotrichaceae bacterium]